MHRSLAVVAVLGTLTAAAAAAGEDPGLASPRIAVVDFALVRRQAAAARAINAQVERHVASYQSDIEKEEQDLRVAQDALAQRRAALSAEAYAAELRRWEQDVSEAQRRFLRRRQEMERARADAWQTVNQRLDAIVGELATERGIDLVLRFDQAAHVSPRLQITEEVLRRLDRELPTIQVVLPEG